jgi:hypothetical protein
VLELIPTDVAIVACHADQPALDRLEPPATALELRIARDELWWIGPLSAREQLAEEGVLALSEADGLVVDQSDGWAVWTVRGAGYLALLERLMLAPIPSSRPAFVQGAITGVPGKVLATAQAALIFVPAPVGHHLRDRILSVGAALDLVEIGTESFTVPAPVAAATSR